MKLVTLNTWGARVGDPFVDFIKANNDIDIFCFQEIYNKATGIMDVDYPQVKHELFSDLNELLPDHQSFFRPVLADVYGIAMFIKNGIEVSEEGDILIHDNSKQTDFSGRHSRNMQWAKCKIDGKEVTIMNVHGLWNGMGKTDTPDRIAQSNAIKNFVDNASAPKILCGDFNLNPDTESLNIVAKGMKNLVSENNVQSTRTSFYEKPGKFADYIFVSPDIEIKDFKVLPEEVSDHAALFLEI